MYLTGSPRNLYLYISNTVGCHTPHCLSGCFHCSDHRATVDFIPLSDFTLNVSVYSIMVNVHGRLLTLFLFPLCIVKIS